MICACTLTNLTMLLPFCVTVMIFSEILTPVANGGNVQWNYICFISFFNTKDLSELTTNMMSDCSSMESLLSSTIPPLIANGITVTLTCILLAIRKM